MAGLGFLLALLVSGNAALTVPLPGEARDAVLVRSSNGVQLHLFLPREDGTFDVRALPPLPMPIRTMALVDADADGDLDLTLLLQDDSVVLWDGDGKGEFFSHERPDVVAHAHHGMLVPALEPAQESALRTVLRDTLARRDPPLAGPGRLPAGLTPRGIVSGRFSLGGVEQTAVVLSDVRPRLAILSADGTTATDVKMTPNTIFTVFVGQTGFSFSPSQVTLQPGDSVHWVWSSIGHTVNSGSSCTSNNLFCSPNNTGCATNGTSGTGATYDRTFNTAGTFPYFCRPHCAFGMTGTVFVGTAPGGILEATNLNIAKSGANTQFTYTPACGATSHAIYYGVGGFSQGPQWRDSICTDISGSTTVALANPTGLQYFVVVGQTASAEGSYGKQSGNVERPEAIKVGACDLTQEISTTCP